MVGGLRSRSLLDPAATAVAYFALASASLLWTRGGVQIATMWPAGGLAVAILASVDRSRLPSYAFAIAFGSVGANLACGTPVWTGALYTVANVAETVLVVILLARCPFGRPSFVDVRQVACFCAISAVACAVSTAIASTSTLWSDWRFSLSWFATDLLGIVITAPIVFLTLWPDERSASARAAHSRLPALALAWAGVGPVAVTTFAQSSFQLLFLPFAALLAVTYIAGPLGAAVGTFIIALIGSAAIALGHSPTLLIHDGPTAQAFFLQFYLLILLGCSLSMAALHTTRDLLIAELQERNRLLFMAERTAMIGHWHLDLNTLAVTWSDEVYRLYGLPMGTEPTLEAALRAYHEDDRERLVEAIELSTRTGGEFRLRARIVRPDGAVRHTDVSGEAITVDCTVRSLFGVVQDITQQVEIEHLLKAAQEKALALAARATTLAETDALTGLANRRRAMDALDEAIKDATGSGVPLSVVVFDIDHFKRVNDTHGHLIGDAVLQTVAASARSAVREMDLVGRLGGEEFIALLPGAGRTVAMQVAERLRRAIAMNDAYAEVPPVTVSAGVATLSRQEDGTSLMGRADLALYRAKAEGRNVSRMAG